MDEFPALDNVRVLGLVLVSLVGVWLVLGHPTRKHLAPWFKLHHRRLSSSETSSGEKSPPASLGSSASYTNALPPQRREVLATLPSTAPTYRKVNEEEVQRHLIPMDADYRSCDDDRFTPTGFSVAEIKALGDFPDYAQLSGVPLPQAYDGFDIEKALARPYRPFRWSYHQTMSLTKLETDWWIELENTYKSRIAQRNDLYAKYGSAVVGYLPGSELACKELMEMVLQFVCARYPKYFSLEDNRIFHNRILGTEQDVRSSHPLEILIQNIPEDFAIMMRDEKTGFYFLRAGVICSALGWNIGTKIGLQLHEIHAPIPDYREKMQFSMDRFFTKMPTEKPIQRGSWGLEINQPLYMPPGDPHEAIRHTQDPNLHLEDCHLRVDWQTLRRLPLSAGILFNFKAVFTPVSEFRDEPGVPALLSTILKEGKRDLMVYKSTWHVEHVVLPALERWAAEQVGDGVVDGGWRVATLDESPWFRGWVGKWRGMQGF
ncbi:hypothetical protein P168DRAFT_339547 [Aspergillus campestris IBT 28561]|uniref:HRQ family protein n=1 Tax=Aspergillus campestris (strain IBT 28561) TaxID=1392248 RepID=A0A2I1D8Y9_ASPC2|nr:uncharacterized protein P168DRAFT_339547 [Aspergillus campestris IBT 28561]PKY06341.1 hypothetical protein P168DRAFT_339547 [Aspergillus campestris IBT 28561]